MLSFTASLIPWYDEDEDRYFCLSLNYGCLGDGPTAGKAMDCCLHSCWMLSQDSYPHTTSAEKQELINLHELHSQDSIVLEVDLDDYADLCPGHMELDQLEAAWVIIANSHNGDWSRATEEWREAAGRWRDEYHSLLKFNGRTTNEE